MGAVQLSFLHINFIVVLPKSKKKNARIAVKFFLVEITVGRFSRENGFKRRVWTVRPKGKKEKPREMQDTLKPSSQTAAMVTFMER